MLLTSDKKLFTVYKNPINVRKFNLRGVALSPVAYISGGGGALVREIFERPRQRSMVLQKKIEIYRMLLK